MISEEKVKIMTELARYEKEYGRKDFYINRYQKEDYVRLELIKVSMALTVAFLGVILLTAVLQMDLVLSMLRKDQLTLILIGLLVSYILLFLIYIHFTKKRAEQEYQEAEVRIRVYDKQLEELLRFYEEKEKEDDSPTIISEEKEHGEAINI